MITHKTPHWRIDHPDSGLAVEFVSESAPLPLAPRIHARLTRPERATTFATRDHAVECFAKFLQGQVLDIVRIDAAVSA
jgi:hypothetical protein